jgi:hypothetical protein
MPSTKFLEHIGEFLTEMLTAFSDQNMLLTINLSGSDRAIVERDGL